MKHFPEDDDEDPDDPPDDEWTPERRPIPGGGAARGKTMTIYYLPFPTKPHGVGG